MTLVPFKQPFADGFPEFLDKTTLVKAVLKLGKLLPGLLLGAFNGPPNLPAFPGNKVAGSFGRDSPGSRRPLFHESHLSTSTKSNE
ncbi:hypothetical protein ACFLWS_02200 [Chloroflexota bacterium]